MNISICIIAVIIAFSFKQKYDSTKKELDGSMGKRDHAVKKSAKLRKMEGGDKSYQKSKQDGIQHGQEDGIPQVYVQD